MGFLGSGKIALNRLLAPLNMRLDSLTAERTESRRLANLVRAGHFDRAVFPVPLQFQKCDPMSVLAAVKQFEPKLDKFAARDVPGQYSYANRYFQSPDAEVLYAMVHLHRPRRIIEVGSGNSTLLFRAAIHDASLNTRLISIDPDPRHEIERHADEVIRQKVESFASEELFAGLQRDDILFVDSSHDIKAGNDVVKLFLQVFPALAPGVIVHLHDIFLPYEYPRDWLVNHRWTWTEQYLLHAMLQGSSEFDVLWAGHYLQRNLPGFAAHFRLRDGAAASSIWLRRTESR